MKPSSLFAKFVMCMLLIVGFAQIATAQSGDLSIINDNGTYKVNFTPTSSGSFTLGASSLVAMKAPLGTMTLPNVVTDVTGGPWTLTSPKNSDASFDYWGYTTSGNTPLTFTSGVPITLFTFPAPTPCLGTVTIVDPNNLPASGTGIVNGYDYGTTINSPLSGNIASVSGAGATCNELTFATDNPMKSGAAGSTVSGNVGTEVGPSGGVTPYNYSVATTGCSAPSGNPSALPLPSSSNLVVDSSTGAYTLTAPSNTGTYYFCIKVCDNTGTTCKIATYTLTVGCAANAGSLN